MENDVAMLYCTGRHAESAVQCPPAPKEILRIL